MTRRFDPGILVAALLPLIGILPTLSPGVIDTADGPLHVQRIYAMSVMLGEGNLWPRWIPYFHLGFGYPVFNFYPPGVFYLGGVLVRLGLSATAAFTAVAALAWVLGSVGMYRLARRFVPAHAAVLAAMLWAYAPSRLFEVWDQGSLPQMMAAALVPWLFYGIINTAYHPTRRGLLAIALPLMGIILTHQPITFITALFTAPLALVVPWWAGKALTPSPSPTRGEGNKTDHESGESLTPYPAFKGKPENESVSLWTRYAHVFGGLLLGGMLVAIFLLPLALELRYVQAARGAEDTVDYLKSNFLQPGEIFAQPPAADLTDLRYELPTTLGLIGGILAVPGLIALARRRQWGMLALLALALGFMLFMLVEASLPVWLGIPFFRQLRFPERFLRVGAVLIALAGSAGILLLPKRWQYAGLAVAMIAVLVAALPMAYPNQRFLVYDDLDAADEIDFELTNATWGTTSYDEFDPIWGAGIPLPREVPEQDEYRTTPLRVYVNRVDMARYGDIMQVEQIDTATSRVTLTQEHAVRFHQYYYPGWTAILDGQPVEIVPDEQFGLITVRAPAGEHIIELRYDGTLAQHVGALVTVISLIVAVALWASGRETDERQVENRLAEHPALAIAGGVIAFAAVNALWITPNTLLFRHRSAPDAPVYMETAVNTSFGDTFELLGYTWMQDSAQPGGLYSVMLFWRAERELDREYRPVVQLVNLNVSAAYGASEPFFPGGGHTYNGYPLDRFASEVHEFRVFEDAPPTVARVSVQMLDAETGEPLRLDDGGDRVLLEPLVRIEGNGVEQPDRLQTVFGESVALRCVEVEHEGDMAQARLYWHVLKPPAQDFMTFVHALDANGEIVAQVDAPPLNGNYPPTLWLAGQHLADTYTLANDEHIEQFAIGLYLPDQNTRLNAVQNGEPLADNRLLIPAEGVPCER